MENPYIGQRITFETDNNGPIYRGEITDVRTDWVDVKWDDGMETPISPNVIEAE